MFLWFAALSWLIVALVFNSPAVDYRYVMLGAVLPVAEGAFGGPYLLHTLLGSVLALVLVVVLTRGRRLAARRLVGLPIGMFLHLVLDGTWTRSELFWWPFLGGRPLGSGQIPEFSHLGWSLVLEVVGVAVAVWLVRRYDLTDPARRDQFVRTGRVGRDLARRG
jgi:hypothetical protein